MLHKLIAAYLPFISHFHMHTVNLSSFRKIALHHKSRIRNFLTRLEKKAPNGLDQIVLQADQAVWKTTDCLHCANCCKTMSPTYTKQDIQRISGHLGMPGKEFRKKWLYKDKSGDWLNITQPCQFLNLETNRCNIYDVRPADCSGFPHHTKKRMIDYMHVYKQNIEYCPATYRVVKEIMEKLKVESEERHSLNVFNKQ